MPAVKEGLKIKKPTKERPRPYVCTLCNFAVSRPAYLISHERTHIADRPFACSWPGCEAEYKRSDHLNRHLLVHERARSFACTFEGCDVHCTTSGILQRHLNRHTPAPKLASLCSPRAARTHVLYFIGKSLEAAPESQELRPDLICQVADCKEFGKQFRSQAQMARHEAAEHIHAVQEYVPIICGFCGGAFESETSLQAHLSQEHIRVACAECGTVLVRHKLKKHMLIHNPDREMFPCQQPGCDKTYSTAFNREQHVRSAHRRERPFECSYSGCSQRFAFKASQLRHESNVHVGPPSLEPPASYLHSPPEQMEQTEEEEGVPEQDGTLAESGRGGYEAQGPLEGEGAEERGEDGGDETVDVETVEGVGAKRGLVDLVVGGELGGGLEGVGEEGVGGGEREEEEKEEEGGDAKRAKV